MLPLVVGDRLIGVMDIDSPEFSRFAEADAHGLAELCRILVENVDWDGGLL